jgi:hypothetical protein
MVDGLYCFREVQKNVAWVADLLIFVAVLL